MSQTILILGASGFIGRHLAESLAANEHRVIAATRRPAEFKSPRISNVVSASWQRNDFVPLLAKATSVVHAASASTPNSSVALPQLDGNLRTTLGLIEALQELPDRRLLYLSSGGTLYGDSDQPLNENAPLRPRSYHAAGKIAAEHFIHAWAAQYDGTAVILRASNVYGPGQMPKTGFGIVPTAFECALDGRPLDIIGDTSSLRDYLYVDDLTDLCQRALSYPLEAGTHVFNASAGNGLTLDSLLNLIDRTTGRPIQRRNLPGRKADVRRILLNNLAAKSIFDWEPVISPDEGLKRTWQWHLQQR